MSEPDLVDQIMAYESGSMSEQEIIQFFQYLIDTDMAWTLQGSYGRTATVLIEAGVCMRKYSGECGHLYYHDGAEGTVCLDCGRVLA